MQAPSSAPRARNGSQRSVAPHWVGRSQSVISSFAAAQLVWQRVPRNSFPVRPQVVGWSCVTPQQTPVSQSLGPWQAQSTAIVGAHAEAHVELPLEGWQQCSPTPQFAAPGRNGQ
jgi:hypothetical protein